MDSNPPDLDNVHQRVRHQHSTELAQDYVEAIYDISSAGQPVRVIDLQEVFGVSHVTVIRTLRKLQEQGLLSSAKSKEIALTTEGKKVAVASATRHSLLVRFFCALGVGAEQANADAEGAEHHLSKETFRAIERFLKKHGPEKRDR